MAAHRRRAGDLSQAVEAFNAALQTAPDWANTVALRLALADLALAQKDYAGAVAQYDALASDTTTGAWASEMQWLAATALAQAGHPCAQRRDAALSGVANAARLSSARAWVQFPGTVGPTQR